MRGNKSLFESQRTGIWGALIQAETQIVFQLDSDGKVFMRKDNYMNRRKEYLQVLRSKERNF